jgi:hypothetical protein
MQAGMRRKKDLQLQLRLILIRCYDQPQCSKKLSGGEFELQAFFSFIVGRLARPVQPAASRFASQRSAG